MEVCRGRSLVARALGPGTATPVAALDFIRKHRFNEMCFVGRPAPLSAHFHRSLLDHLEVIDPRVLHAAIDHPQWWQKQREVVAKIETVIDLSAHALGECDDPLEQAGIRIVTFDKRPFKANIFEQHGIRGLAPWGKCELQLPGPVDQVDILIAHFGLAANDQSPRAGQTGHHQGRR